MLLLEDEKLVHLDPSLTEWHYYDGEDRKGVFRLVGRGEKLYMVMLTEEFCLVLHITHGVYGRHLPLNQQAGDVTNIQPELALLEFSSVYSSNDDMPYKQMIADGFLTVDEFMRYRQPQAWAEKLPHLQLRYYYSELDYKL